MPAPNVSVIRKFYCTRIEKLDKFNESYLSSENLAYHELCENYRKFKVMLYIPDDVYDYLVNELRGGSRSYDVLSIPVVRGYIFENEFLSSPKLEDTPLTVLAVGMGVGVSCLRD